MTAFLTSNRGVGVLAAVLLLITLAGCVPVLGILNRVPPDYVIKQPDGAWLITEGGGGDVGGHLDYRAKLERDGGRVVIDGGCYSACTVFYSLPKACLTYRAMLGFHAAAGAATNVWENAMARHYRAGVLAAYNAVWRHRESLLPLLNRNEMRDLDPETEFCGD